MEHQEPGALTADEVVRLADAIDPRHRALMLIGGLRTGELGGHQLGDFDPLRSAVRIRRGISDVRGQVVVGPPKTTKSIRTVNLPRSSSTK